MSSHVGPQTQAAELIDSMKYRERGEDFREAINRVAFGLKDSDEHYKALREILLGMRFIPAGRIKNAIGAIRKTTPYNCYVSGTIEDSFTDGNGSIMIRALEAAATMRMGGGIGYDFSTLRYRGAEIGGIGSHSSGPVSFMHIFDAVCLATKSSGHRRGAQMGVMRVDHPDIEEFVRAKQNTTSLLGFNISVAITDEFMEAAAAGKPFWLRFGDPPRNVREIDAAALMEKIMRSTWDWAEPGVLFIDQINRMNSLYYCEKIAATNPCGEQPLPPFGACLLGSFNLTKYLLGQAPTNTTEHYGWRFNWEQLLHDIPIVVRAMDNVVDRARYPLTEQKVEAHNKRRMGLGIMGLANCAEAQGFAYGSPDFVAFEEKVLRLILNESYRASSDLAREKGSFLAFDPIKYCKGKFFATLDQDVRELIAKQGLRNSHLTSIAPTGTISMSADNVTGGIEPVFAYKVTRPINTPEGAQIFELEDYGAKFLGVRGKLARDVTVDEHLAVLLAAQKYMDSSVSKTINMTEQMPWEDFKAIYSRAHAGGAKGCTTFNSDGKRIALLSESADEAIACKIDTETGQRDCS
jgi:ribonucleoside-diphosphate reductase alpha chain